MNENLEHLAWFTFNWPTWPKGTPFAIKRVSISGRRKSVSGLAIAFPSGPLQVFLAGFIGTRGGITGHSGS